MPTTPPPDTTTAPTSLSPLHHTSSFPHQTSANVATRTPYIDTSTPAINAAPVELDGGEAVAVGDVVSEEKEERAKGMGKGSVRQLSEEEELERGFLGRGEEGDVQEKRAAMLATRSKDPSVIVDVPQDPTAEEVEAAKIAEGTVTPAVGGEGK